MRKASEMFKKKKKKKVSKINVKAMTTNKNGKLFTMRDGKAEAGHDSLVGWAGRHHIHYRLTWGPAGGQQIRRNPSKATGGITDCFNTVGSTDLCRSWAENC